MWKNHKLNNSAISLKRALREYICGIVYIKIDGGYREALGSTHRDCIPKHALPKGKMLRHDRKTIRYFDLMKGEWRSLRRTSLIGYWIVEAATEYGEG